MFQVFGILAKTNIDGKRKFAIPKGVNAMCLNKSLEKRMYCYAEEVKVTENSTFYNAVLLSEKGNVIAEIENFYTKIISSNSIQIDRSIEYCISWSEVFDLAETRVSTTGPVILCSNASDSDLVLKLRKVV